MKDSQPISVGILTISDRCSQGKTTDESGPTLQKEVKSHGWNVCATAIVPDGASQIKKVLLDWVDQKKIRLILTTGGTGIGPRDITPEVTQSLLDKEIPGISDHIRSQGMKVNFFSALSRAVTGIRKKSLIVNLPGNPLGARESLLSIIGMIPHTLKMIHGHNHEVREEVKV